MFFKFFTVTIAFASIVSGAAVNLEARRQGELATCVITTRPSSLPNPESALNEEFIQLFIRAYERALPPGTGMVTGSTSFTGSGLGPYTVTKALGSFILTAEETRQVMRSWTGQTFGGQGQVGVDSWFIENVAC